MMFASEVKGYFCKNETFQRVSSPPVEWWLVTVPVVSAALLILLLLLIRIKWKGEKTHLYPGIVGEGEFYCEVIFSFFCLYRKKNTNTS